MSDAREKSRGVKIIWAFDPFVQPVRLQEKAAEAIRDFTRGREAETFPTYCFNSYDLSEASVERDSQVKEAGQKAISRLKRKCGLHGLKGLEMICLPDISSKRETAETLLRFARSKEADLIVVSTHARSGPKRWIMGSFAETLILRSSIPTLIVNPRWRPAQSFKHVLFPTDFSDESREAFRRAVGLAKGLNAELTLFHKLPRGSKGPSERQLHPTHREALRWADEGRAGGVRVAIRLDRRKSGSVAEAILAFSKIKPGLIAMASRSGPVSATLLGSVTRQVLRASEWPVWVIHAEREALCRPLKTG